MFNVNTEIGDKLFFLIRNFYSSFNPNLLTLLLLIMNIDAHSQH